MITFSAILGGLAVLGLILFFLAGQVAQQVDLDADRSAMRLTKAQQFLEPIGHAVVAGSPEAEAEAAQQLASATPAAAKAALSGEEVFTQACAACHNPPGIPNAPMVGDQAAWAERADKGLETLIDHVANGFNAMPAQGALFDEQSIVNAIAYILDQSGVSTGSTTDAGTSATTDTDTAAAAPSTAPATDPPPAALSEPAAEATAEAVVAAAADAFEVPAGVDASQGEAVYNQACMACHTTGAAGAPKIGDSDAWAPRLAQGWDVLSARAVQGFQGEVGYMPAKGGRTDLSDEQVNNAIAYMLAQSQ